MVNRVKCFPHRVFALWIQHMLNEWNSFTKLAIWKFGPFVRIISDFRPVFVFCSTFCKTSQILFSVLKTYRHIVKMPSTMVFIQLIRFLSHCTHKQAQMGSQHRFHNNLTILKPKVLKKSMPSSRWLLRWPSHTWRGKLRS